MTREFTPLEPDVVEQKFYARGVGQIQALQTSGGSVVRSFGRTSRAEPAAPQRRPVLAGGDTAGDVPAMVSSRFACLSPRNIASAGMDNEHANRWGLSEGTVTENDVQPSADEAFWQEYLTRGRSTERRFRLVFKRLPRNPRCRLCAAPFAGAGAPLMSLIGKRQAASSTSLCSSCFKFLSTHHGGAEIDCTMLFADIRGSTALAEAMSPADFQRLLDRFYTVASRVVFAHDGMSTSSSETSSSRCSFRS